jgi:hypothetical protein
MSLEMTKKQLVDLLGRTDDQVIALSGKWGTGKTHLWKEVREEATDNRVRDALYVSLFGLSSIDQVKRKLMEGALPSAALGGGRLEVLKNLLKGGVTAAASHYKALAAINDLNLLLMAPVALRRRVIVIDDIERKHDKLGIDEVLGFIDEYAKEFEVRFVLVLNDDQLSSKGEQEKLWTTFREKVIDHEIRLSTSPDEAFSIAVQRWPSSYEQALKRSVLACGLTNIRIIGKVVKAANQILGGRRLSDAIQERVVPSVVLFSAIHYRGIEDGPSFQFALNIADPEWSDLSQNENAAPTEQAKREDRWRLLMSELGIHGCDEFEKVLVEFLESGLFEDDKVQAIIDRYVAEAQSMDARERARTFITKVIWDHRTSEADLINEAAVFVQIADQLDPYLATEMHGILSELAGASTLADGVIQAWIAAFQASCRPAPDDDDLLGRQLHPDIEAAFKAATAHAHAQSTVVDACKQIIERNGWGTMQEMVMRKATAADFESAIRSMDVEELPQFMRRMIRMRLQRATYDQHFGRATEHFVDACRTIAHDTRPASARLAALVRRLFAKTTLVAELSPPPASPAPSGPVSVP